AKLRKCGPQRLIDGGAGLDLEHDQGRMTIEECLAAAEDALLLAFRIDLDEIDRGPASRTVFRIEGGDPHRFSRTAAFEAVQLARRAEHEMAFPRTVGRRRRDHMQIVRAIDAAAALEQGPRRACRLL